MTGSTTRLTSPLWGSGQVWNLIGLAGFVLLVAAQAYGLLTSPPDRDMGHLQ